MRAEIRSRWVDALRSGRYRQATGHLQIDGAHCCLGVLCELAVEDEVIPAPEFRTRTLYGETEQEGMQVAMYDGCDDLLPPSVARWAGLDECNPVIPFPDDEGAPYGSELSELNDNGYRFEAIATAIADSL